MEIGGRTAVYDMATYRCKDFCQINAWQKSVGNPQIQTKLQDFMEVAVIEDAGVYGDIGSEQR